MFIMYLVDLRLIMLVLYHSINNVKPNALFAELFLAENCFITRILKWRENT